MEVTDKLEELYGALYGSAGKKFVKLAPKAVHLVENATTGVDGFNKLREAFPTDKTDSDCVLHCVCDIIHTLFQIEEAKEAAALANSMTARGDGTYTPTAVSSVSSGSESISYATHGSQIRTSIEAAAGSTAERNALINATIRDYLAGVRDANGVNLLYRGEYPYVC